jgi:CheY-like chemotaxis protein
VVLAVDDDPLVLTNTVAMLEELGHTAYPAASADEALKILKSDNKIDLVITDQVMPRMTGLQLVNIIRREWPDMPVLLATGYAELDDDVNVKAPRLAKPFTLTDLAGQMSRMSLRSRNGGQIIKFRGNGAD